MPDFSVSAGAKAAEEMENEARAARSTGRRYRVPQLVIKDGFDGIERILTPRDVWQTVETHQFMPTKDKPEAWGGDNWPKLMWGICRRARIFRLRDGAGNPIDEFEEGYGDCYLCEAYAGVKDEKFSFDKGVPTPQTYAVAVNRSPQLSNGATIGFQDKMTEFKDAAGTTHQIPEFVMIAQGYRNFWGGVESSLYVAGADVRERDYRVQRKGKDWTVSSVNTDPVHKPGAPSWEKYQNALKLTGFGGEEGDVNQGLFDYILSHATLDHYNTWFIPGAEPEGGYGRKDSDDTAKGEDTAATTAATPAAPGVDPDAMAGFAESMKNRATAGK